MKEFYALNRFLIKLIKQDKSRGDEIDSIDVSKLSEITKVLLTVNIKFQDKEFLFDKKNLQSLKNVGPLKDWLNLVAEPLRCHEIYNYYKVGW